MKVALEILGMTVSQRITYTWSKVHGVRQQKKKKKIDL